MMDNSQPKAVSQEPQAPAVNGGTDVRGRGGPGMYRRAEMRARAESLASTAAFAGPPAEFPVYDPLVPQPADIVDAGIDPIAQEVRASHSGKGSGVCSVAIVATARVAGELSHKRRHTRGE